MQLRFVLFIGLIAPLLATTPLRADAQVSVGGGALGVAPVLAGVVAPPVAMSLDDVRLTCPAVIASSAAAYEIQGPRRHPP
jgi:hypothetical protein